jgi:hypothetical protein
MRRIKVSSVGSDRWFTRTTLIVFAVTPRDVSPPFLPPVHFGTHGGEMVMPVNCRPPLQWLTSPLRTAAGTDPPPPGVDEGLLTPPSPDDTFPGAPSLGRDATPDEPDEPDGYASPSTNPGSGTDEPLGVEGNIATIRSCTATTPARGR